MNKEPKPIINAEMLGQIRPYDEWSMFTKYGNDVLKKKAQRLIKQVQEATTFSAIAHAFEIYVKGYNKTTKSKKTLEAGDTDVRDGVYGFALRVAETIQIGDLFEAIWNYYYWNH